jgi:hypothetical protein
MGNGVSEVINHTAPTSCIQVPTFDATAATHSARKTGWYSRLQAEAVRPLVSAPGIATGRLPLPTELLPQARAYAPPMPINTASHTPEVARGACG